MDDCSGQPGDRQPLGPPFRRIELSSNDWSISEAFLLQLQSRFMYNRTYGKNQSPHGVNRTIMGDRNQILFALPFKDSFRPPFLEVGSFEYGNTSSFRNIFPHGEGDYIGIDVIAGPGVDRVVDLTSDFNNVSKVLPEKFNTIICLSVLEHCQQPFTMAQNLEKLLNPGGVLYVSVPFCWRIHDYPADYWRFTPAGIRNLFPEIFFPETHSAYHSSDQGVFFPAQEAPPKIEFYFSAARRSYGFIQAFLVYVIRKLGIARPIFKHSYIFPPLQLEMIGQKKREP